MPGPKTCQCSICGETVLKSTTLHIGDNKRACRSHPETEEIGAKLKEKEKERLNNLHSPNKPTFPKQHDWEERRNLATKPRCFCCENFGVEKSHLNLNYLRASKAYEIITGEIGNLLFPTKEFKEYLQDVMMLHYGYIPVSLNISHDIPKWMKLKLTQNTEYASLPFFIICDGCIIKHRMEKYFKQPELPGIKDLMVIGGILDSLLEEEIKTGLLKELEKNNVQ